MTADGEPVTVIVLGYNSLAYLEECFTSLGQLQGIPGRVKVLFVDNASQDGSSTWVREHCPHVEVVENERNLGFSAGNNVGARHATTPWIAFLNPDMRVSPGWLVEAFKVVGYEPAVDCVACRIMSWDGNLVDFAGAAMNFYGYGMQEGMGEPLTEAGTEDRDVLFACGGAMIIRREVFLATGGFDEDYFGFFEDMDLGWRLWVLGYRVKYAGQAVVYHHHHGSWGQTSDRYRQALSERNTLCSILKNYEEETLQKALPAALLLMGFRAFLSSGLSAADYRPADPLPVPPAQGLVRWLRDAVVYYGPRAWHTFWREGPLALMRKVLGEVQGRLEDRRRRRQAAQMSEPPAGEESMLKADTTRLPDRTLAYLDAAQSIVALHEPMLEKRRIIQAARRRPDGLILPLFRRALVPNYPDYEHFRALQLACDMWSLYDIFPNPER